MAGGGSLFKLDFSVEGTEKLSLALNGVLAVLDDFTEVWEKIAEDFYKIQKARFSAEGAFDGKQKWKSLKPTYLVWKQWYLQKHGLPLGAKILHLKGDLETSLTRPNSTGNIHKITKTSLTIGTSIRVGKKQWSLGMLHQLGTSKMPARPPVEVGNKQIARWRQIMHRILGKNIDNRLGRGR